MCWMAAKRRMPADSPDEARVMPKRKFNQCETRGFRDQPGAGSACSGLLISGTQCQCRDIHLSVAIFTLVCGCPYHKGP